MNIDDPRFVRKMNRLFDLSEYSEFTPQIRIIDGEYRHFFAFGNYPLHNSYLLMHNILKRTSSPGYIGFTQLLYSENWQFSMNDRKLVSYECTFDELEESEKPDLNIGKILREMDLKIVEEL